MTRVGEELRNHRAIREFKNELTGYIKRRDTAMGGILQGRDTHPQRKLKQGGVGNIQALQFQKGKVYRMSERYIYSPYNNLLSIYTEIAHR